MDVGLSAYFTWTDWLVVFLYLAGTTWLGHALSGKQSTIQDFFLAGRSLPWWAVSGSIIATSISALTFVGVPSIVFAAGGNWTYLQLAIGSILARLIIARWFVPAFYDNEIYSPYEFIKLKLGNTAGNVATVLFFLGGILGQGVRVFVTALVLQLVLGIDLWASIAIIGVFSILWTWMGGMATVIWTDVVQFFLFIIGGTAALVLILSALPYDSTTAIEKANEAGKLQVLSTSTDLAVAFTIWAALFAIPFQNLAAYGTDQLNAQRMFCCKNSSEATKAIVASCGSELITILMLAVGTALFLFYMENPMPAMVAAAREENGSTIFPAFILTEMPVGIRGLILAGVFAAAISSLDSILAALSQSTITTFYKPYLAPDEDDAHYLWVSRWVVIAWGLILSVMAWLMHLSQSDVISLAFSMVSFTYGPILALFLLALLPLDIFKPGLLVGIPLAVATIVFLNFQPTIFNPFVEQGALSDFWSNRWLSWPWFYPIGFAIAFVSALPRPKKLG